MFGRKLQKDVHESFKTVLVISTIFGLNPYSKNKKLHLCLQIYSCALPILNLVYGLAIVRTLENIFPEWYETKLFFYIDLVNILIGYVTYMVAVKVCVLYRKRISVELKSLRSIDRLFYDVGYPFYYDSRNHNWVTFVLLASIPTVFILDLAYFSTEKTTGGTMEMVAIYLPSFFIHIVSCQWYCFVKSLGDHYIHATQLIEDAILNKDRRLSLPQIHKLAIAHLKLHKAGMNFNSIYGTFNLANVTYIFQVTTTHLFFTIVTDHADEIIEIAVFIAISCFRLLGLWAVVTTSERTSFEAGRFNTTLHKLTIMDPFGETSKDEKIFLHLLMKNQIKFSGAGFFPIDYTLVQTMVASATTFLVILVQFFHPTQS